MAQQLTRIRGSPDLLDPRFRHCAQSIREDLYLRVLNELMDAGAMPTNLNDGIQGRELEIGSVSENFFGCFHTISPERRRSLNFRLLTKVVDVLLQRISKSKPVWLQGLIA